MSMSLNQWQRHQTVVGCKTKRDVYDTCLKIVQKCNRDTIYIGPAVLLISCQVHGHLHGHERLQPAQMAHTKLTQHRHLRSLLPSV